MNTVKQEMNSTVLDAGNIIKSLHETGKVSDQTLRSIMDFWERLAREEEEKPNYLKDFLFDLSINYGIWGIYLIRKDDRKLMYRFSPENDGLLQKIVNTAEAEEGSDEGTIPRDSENFRLFTQKIVSNEVDYILAILPLALDTDTVVLDKIKNIFENYYLLMEPSKNTQIINFYKLTSQDVLERLSAFPKDHTVTFIYFEFEPLKKYVKYGGDFFAQEVVDQIKSKLYATLSESVICYALTLRKYVVVCPNLENEDAKERLKGVTFYLKQILLTYKVNYFTTKLPIDNLQSVWEKLSQQ